MWRRLDKAVEAIGVFPAEIWDMDVWSQQAVFDDGITA